MAVIEEALKRTAGQTNPSFRYIDAILAAWHKDGIKNAEQLKAYLETAPEQSKGQVSKKTGRRNNFQQRQYDDEFFEKLNRSNITRKDKA